MDDDDFAAAFAELSAMDPAPDAYQDVAAEMRGVARCARAYFRTLLAGPLERDEAFALLRDWHRSYWDAQHDLLRG